MEKFVQQFDKYLQAQQIQKIFLTADQSRLFFLKRIQTKLLLYYVNLQNPQQSKIDITSAIQVTEASFEKCQFKFENYFPDTEQLFVSLDNNNDEFSNLYEIDLKKTQPVPMQITNAKNALKLQWNKDRTSVYFINQTPVDKGLFFNEVVKYDFATKTQQVLFNDKTWKFKIGWGGLLLTEDEKALIIGVDKDNKRQETNFVKVELGTLPPGEIDEPTGLLDKTFEDGFNLISKVSGSNEFTFASNHSGFDNFYSYNLTSHQIQNITTEKWINITYSFVEINKVKALIVCEPIKNSGRTKVRLFSLAKGKGFADIESISQELVGNYLAVNEQAYLIKNSIDQVPTVCIFDENLKFVSELPKFEGKDLVHCTYQILPYKSFDGLEIFAYFVKPKVPIRAVAVISFYGGENYYHHYEQLLLENGIAIYSPAVRGSWGWGRDWEDHLKGDLGGKEIVDVIWAAKFIKNHLNLEEKQIGLWGASHGGYATLRALTLPKDYLGIDSRFNFGFGICECGFADLEDFYKTSRIADWLGDLLGAYADHVQLYRDRSPVNYFQNLKAPLFIRHGTTDTRVPISTMNEFIKKLKASDIKHQILIQENQGHHTNDPVKEKQERAIILTFIDQVLNGPNT